MADIFVSSAEEDDEQVAVIVGIFERQGWTVWWPGSQQQSRRHDVEVERQLREACCVVAFWTPSAVESRWVRNEAADAEERGILLSVTLESTKPPVAFRHLRAVRLQTWPATASANGMDAVLGNVATMIEQGGVDETSMSGSLVEDAPTLSVRVARRVIESLRQSGHLAPDLLEASQIPSHGSYLRVGKWLVKPDLNQITSNSTTKPISPRAVEVLVFMATNQNRTLSVDDILKGVWGDRIVVDSAVHRCISELRDVLEDSSREPRFIKTIPRRGYRVIADVELYVDP